MIVYDINFTLKDGRAATLRSPREEDIDNIIDFLIKSAGETDYLLRYPEEYENITHDAEKNFLDRINSSENDAMIVCSVEGQIAGSCQITFFQGKKSFHRTRVAIALLCKFWNNGIGSKMFSELIRIAESRAGVEQIELEYIEGNSRARALYEKFGFRIVGVHPDAIKLKDGTYLNEYLMIKKL